MRIKIIFISLVFVVSINAGQFLPFKISIGGGYPFGIVSTLNNDFKEAYDQATSAFGSFDNESLTKTGGGSFCSNIGFANLDTTKNVFFGGIVGYSYHGTGKAKYELVDNSVPMTLSVTGKYSVNEIRLMPCLVKIGEKEAFGGGAGLAYNFVKYTQESGNSSGSFNLPKTDSKSSGATWCIYGFVQIHAIGVEAELNGLNTFYLGAFLDIVFVD